MKIYQGKVTGMKMAKTLTVEVERILAHPVYKKRFKRSKKYHVHSELEHKLGDIVRFVECPPISKSKRWKEVEAKSAKTETKISGKEVVKSSEKTVKKSSVKAVKKGK